jgi:hypothetical protein
MMENLTSQVARNLTSEGADTEELLIRVDEISAALLYLAMPGEMERARTAFLETLKTLSPEERSRTARAVDAIVQTLEEREPKEAGFNAGLIRKQLAQIRSVAEFLKASNQK